MKKRNTDGFALIYVVVVIFILCAIALALMSATLRTLQAQEASIRRMEQKYAAQGEIERLVAELEDAILALPSDDGFDGDELAEQAGIAALKNCIDSYSMTGYQTCRKTDFELREVKNPDDISGPKIKVYQLDATATSSLVKVDATLQFNFDVSTNPYDVETDEYKAWKNSGSVEDPPPQFTTKYRYDISDEEVHFFVYQVTSVGGETE